MKLSSSPLTAKVGYAIFFASLIVTVMMTMGQLFYEFEKGKSEIKEQIDLIEKTLSPSIAHAAWHFDSLQLKALMSGMIQNENISGVRIYIDSNGPDAFLQLNTSFPNDGGSLSYPIIVDNEVGKPETIGKIQLLLTHSAIHKRTQSIISGVALTQLIRTVIISYFIYVIFMNMVIKRLIDLKRYINEAHKSNSGDISPPKNSILFFEDEINSLTSQTVEAFTNLRAAKEQAGKDLEARQQVQSRLVEISLQLGSFQSVAGIFHDLNNIIMIAFTGLTRLKKTVPTLPTPIVEQMEKSFLLAKDLIKSQQQMSMKSLNSEQLNLSSLVKDILTLNSFELRRQGISTSIEIEPSLEAYISRPILMLVILNLLKNSAEAIVTAKQNMGKISIKAKRDGAFVSVLIADNGPGIPESYADKLFAFGETTKTDGHGFGLSSSKKSLQSLGADLIYHKPSNPQQSGASFEILIPSSAKNVPKVA